MQINLRDVIFRCFIMPVIVYFSIAAALKEKAHVVVNEDFVVLQFESPIGITISLQISSFSALFNHRKYLLLKQFHRKMTHPAGVYNVFFSSSLFLVF